MLFTSADKDMLPTNLNEACIVITTYSMMCHSGKRSESGELRIQQVKEREWGLLVLDEVHVAPAGNFLFLMHHSFVWFITISINFSLNFIVSQQKFSIYFKLIYW